MIEDRVCCKVGRTRRPIYFTPGGTYIITAATLHRKRLFDSDLKLDLFRNIILELARTYELTLQAWAFLSNQLSFGGQLQKHDGNTPRFRATSSPRTNDAA